MERSFYFIREGSLGRMTFQVEHEKFIQHHLARRSGERRGRLERGHRHGEILFAHDIEQRPEVCIALLRMVLNRYLPSLAPVSRPLLAEKEVIKLAIQLVEPIRPIDVQQHFEIDHKTAVLLLKKLNTWLKPSLRGQVIRNVRYELAKETFDYFN